MAVKTKKKQLEQNETTTIINAVKGIKIDEVVSKVNNLQVTMQKVLADVCANVTTQVRQINELDTAINIKNDHLKELHDIEQEAMNLDEIRAKREEELEKWNLDRQCRKRQWDEEEVENQKARTRREEEWKYEFEVTKKRTIEDFNVQAARTKRDEQLRHENLERDWTARENALKAREQEIVTLRTQVAEFDAKLAENTKKAEATGFSCAAAKYNHEIALLKKDSENEKRMAEMRIASLNSQIDAYSNQIEDLFKQLNSARQDAKDVASKALDGASNKQLTETLQKVLTDSQQTSGKSK